MIRLPLAGQVPAGIDNQGPAISSARNRIIRIENENMYENHER